MEEVVVVGEPLEVTVEDAAVEVDGGLVCEGGGGLAVVVLCAEQLIIFTTASKRAGSVELHETIPFRHLLQEKAGRYVQ